MITKIKKFNNTCVGCDGQTDTSTAGRGLNRYTLEGRQAGDSSQNHKCIHPDPMIPLRDITYVLTWARRLMFDITLRNLASNNVPWGITQASLSGRLVILSMVSLFDEILESHFVKKKKKKECKSFLCTDTEQAQCVQLRERNMLCCIRQTNNRIKKVKIHVCVSR